MTATLRPAPRRGAFLRADWRYLVMLNYEVDADVRGLYGAEWEGVLAGAPRSAFVAEGSAVTVYRPRRVR